MSPQCLNEAIGETVSQSTNQFGFRKARYIIKAVNPMKTLVEKTIGGKRWKDGKIQDCMVTIIDVKHAFNSAS